MRCFLLCVIAVATTPTAALAAPAEPIVLAGGDDAFRAALSDALAPAGMTVLTVENPPSPTIGDVAARSRELADGKQASATVWLVFDGGAATLIAYDREVDRELVRALPYTSPLTPAQAAEAASMARTMLRALRVTPDLDVAPPHASDAAAVRARAAAPPPPPVVAGTLPMAPVIAAELGGGVRLGGPAKDAQLEGTVALIARPDHLGAAVSLAIAARGDLQTSMFAGTVVDDSLAAAARLPVPAGRAITLVGTAGMAVHRVALAGDVAGHGAVAIPRYDPATRLGLAAEYRRGAIGISLGVTVDALLRRQLYEVDATEILEVPRFQVAAGLTLVARVQ